MNRKTKYAFAFSFILLLAAIVMNHVVFREMKRYSQDVDHTRQVINTFERISNHYKSAQILTTAATDLNGKKFFEYYSNDANQINDELKLLSQMVSDSRLQTTRVDSLSKLIYQQIAALRRERIDQIIASGKTWRLPQFFAVEDMIDRGILYERSLLKHRKAELEHTTGLFNLITSLFSIIAVAVFIGYFVFTFFINKQRNWLEQLLASILNTSPNGIMYFRAIKKNGLVKDFRLRFLNKAVQDLLNVTAENAINSTVRSYPQNMLDVNLFEKCLQAMQTDKTLIFEARFTRVPVEKWFLVSIGRAEEGVTASFQDITQLKQYEMELTQNIQQLQRSNRELEQYAYVASHDLQEPLRKIRSFGSFLMETQHQNLSEKGQEQLQKMINAAEKMSMLIKDILSFASMQRAAQYTKTNLNATLKGALADLELTIEQKQAQIIAAPLPTIEAIPLQMTQLFYNLLNNSLKFSMEGRPPVIKISCKPIPAGTRPKLNLPLNANYFEIAFEDNGIGFDQEYAAQIFGLFKTLNDRKQFPGSGIGLSLCKKVVENHNGLLLATGTEHAGATFYVYLPEQQSN